MIYSDEILDELAASMKQNINNPQVNNDDDIILCSLWIKTTVSGSNNYFCGDNYIRLNDGDIVEFEEFEQLAAVEKSEIITEELKKIYNELECDVIVKVHEGSFVETSVYNIIIPSEAFEVFSMVLTSLAGYPIYTIIGTIILTATGIKIHKINAEKNKAMEEINKKYEAEKYKADIDAEIKIKAAKIMAEAQKYTADMQYKAALVQIEKLNTAKKYAARKNDKIKQEVKAVEPTADYNRKLNLMIVSAFRSVLLYNKNITDAIDFVLRFSEEYYRNDLIHSLESELRLFDDGDFNYAIHVGLTLELCQKIHEKRKSMQEFSDFNPKIK